MTDPNVRRAAPEAAEISYDTLTESLIAEDLRPLWQERRRLNTPQPNPGTLPWLWKWRTILPLAEAAGRLVTLDRGGDRRVLALTNPGLGGLPFCSSTLWGAIQYLGAGESAPAHRHSAAAIRFVVEGSGAHTTVNGDSLDMAAGDLILTPSWHWHDHTNAGSAAMTWFDGLDLPLVISLDSVFFDHYPELMQAVASRNAATWPTGNGIGRADDAADRPCWRYPWSAIEHELDRLQPHAQDGLVIAQYRNPHTGGDVTLTLGCEVHRLTGQRPIRARRRVGNSIYVAYRGHGRTLVNDQQFEWEQGDIFVSPSWAQVRHEADGPADLFVLTDRPALKSLGLYREQIAEVDQ